MLETISMKLGDAIVSTEENTIKEIKNVISNAKEKLQEAFETEMKIRDKNKENAEDVLGVYYSASKLMDTCIEMPVVNFERVPIKEIISKSFIESTVRKKIEADELEEKEAEVPFNHGMISKSEKTVSEKKGIIKRMNIPKKMGEGYPAHLNVFLNNNDNTKENIKIEEMDIKNKIPLIKETKPKENGTEKLLKIIGDYGVCQLADIKEKVNNNNMNITTNQLYYFLGQLVKNNFLTKIKIVSLPEGRLTSFYIFTEEGKTYYQKKYKETVKTQTINNIPVTQFKNPITGYYISLIIEFLKEDSDRFKNIDFNDEKAEISFTEKFKINETEVQRNRVIHYISSLFIGSNNEIFQTFNSCDKNEIFLIFNSKREFKEFSKKVDIYSSFIDESKKFYLYTFNELIKMIKDKEDWKEYRANYITI